MKYLYRKTRANRKTRTNRKTSRRTKKSMRGGARCYNALCQGQGGGLIKGHVFEGGVCKYCGCSP